MDLNNLEVKIIFFEYIENLHNLESSNDWGGTIKLLESNWLNDKENLGKIVRYASQCWYILNEWQFLNLEKNFIDKETIKSKLIEVYNYANNKLLKNEKIFLIFGYMISITPFYFYSSDDISDATYKKYEKIGKNFLEQAYKLNPNDKIIKIIYFSSLSNMPKQLAIYKNELSEVIDTYFSTETEVENYFREILTLIN